MLHPHFGGVEKDKMGICGGQRWVGKGGGSEREWDSEGLGR